MAVISDENHVQRGRKAEDDAARFLMANGLTMIEMNWGWKGGEIDIIAQDGQALVFVEVKWRAKPYKGSALQSVPVNKQKLVMRSAQIWCKRNGRRLDRQPIRFDVLAATGLPYDWQWVRGAFRQ